MRAISLPRAIRHVVGLSLAAGCASQFSSGTIPPGDDDAGPGNASEAESGTASGEQRLDDGWMEACTGSTFPFAVGFRPGTPVDFLAFRAGPASFVEPQGTPCSGATDPASCQSKLEALPFEEPAMCDRRRPIVYTRGDEVGLVAYEDEAAFLAPIDTKEEAFYIGRSRTTPSCMYEPRSRWRVSPSGGIDVSIRAGQCSNQPEPLLLRIVHVTPDGTVEPGAEQFFAMGEPCGPDACGRRPRGLRRAQARRGHLVGDHLARAAHLEAASVFAFEAMHRELASLGAPPRLLASVTRAREDEVRHARTTARLARRFGATAPAARVRPAKPRSALAIAVENAREGCVRETLGAAVALFSAERAKDRGVARALRAIARDEVRHARLSWQVGEWLDERLSPRERASVRRAKARAIDELHREIAGVRAAPSAEVVRVLGVPSPPELLDLFARLERSVWNPVT